MMSGDEEDGEGGDRHLGALQSEWVGRLPVVGLVVYQQLNHLVLWFSSCALQPVSCFVCVSFVWLQGLGGKPCLVISS